MKLSAALLLGAALACAAGVYGWRTHAGRAPLEAMPAEDCVSPIDARIRKVEGRVVEKYKTSRVAVSDVFIPEPEDLGALNQMGILAVRVLGWQPEALPIEQVAVTVPKRRVSEELPRILPQSRPFQVKTLLGGIASEAYYFIPLRLLSEDATVVARFQNYGADNAEKQTDLAKLGEAFRKIPSLAAVKPEDPRKLPEPQKVLQLLRKRYCR